MPSLGHHIGRYEILGTLGAGGMATVLLARYCGPMGFWRPVAIKRLHESLARDPAFVSMLLDEARLGSQVRHPLVTEVVDLVAEDSEVCLVMQYVHGAALRALLDADSSPVPVSIAAAVLSDTLNGLHAAHEARDGNGLHLGIVHRDVSPHNLLVGADGFTRVTDFGIAKAVWRAQTTSDGQLKGKLAYMAPEQLGKAKVDRRADIFGASVVMWELLAGKRLFEGTDPDDLLARGSSWSPPGIGRADLPAELEQVVARGLAPDRSERFDSALQMAAAIERSCCPASRAEVAAWVERLAGGELARRASQLAEGTGSRDSSVSAAGISSAWKVAPDSATLPHAELDRERTPSGLGPTAMNSARPRPAPRRTAIVAALAAALAVFATISFAQLRSRHHADSDAPVHAAGPTPVLEPQRTAPAGQPAVMSSAPAIAATTAAPSAAAAPSTTQKDYPAPTRTSRPSKPSPAAPQPGCNPPYRTDDTGVKVYKVECL